MSRKRLPSRQHRIARWPGRIRPESQSDLPISFADVAPTLVELAGSSLEGVDGLSFLPTLVGRGRQKRHEYLYWESAHEPPPPQIEPPKPAGQRWR